MRSATTCSSRPVAVSTSPTHTSCGSDGWCEETPSRPSRARSHRAGAPDRRPAAGRDATPSATRCASPPPRSGATAATDSPSRPTRRHAHRRARSVSAARLPIAACLSVHVTTAHADPRQRQRRLRHRSRTGRSNAATSPTTSTRSCACARTVPCRVIETDSLHFRLQRRADVPGSAVRMRFGDREPASMAASTSNSNSHISTSHGGVPGAAARPSSLRRDAVQRAFLVAAPMIIRAC